MNPRAILVLAALACSSVTGCRPDRNEPAAPMLAPQYAPAVAEPPLRVSEPATPGQGDGYPPAVAPARPDVRETASPLPRYEIFVDLTGSINIAIDGKMSTRLPGMTLRTVQTIVGISASLTS